jgi:5-methylcytosine-specific restriction endonuclease McrA
MPRYNNERERKAIIDKQRPSSAERGYDAAWRAVRKQFIAAHPHCCVQGCGLPTVDVDHVLSIEARPDLRLVWSNLRPFCKPHHSARTARDQGFGRKGEGGSNL